MPNVQDLIKEVAIDSFVAELSHTGTFKRVVNQILIVNKEMPNASGDEKKARVLAKCKIIFDDLLEPMSKKFLNLLIELGVSYVAAVYPVAGPAAAVVGHDVQSKINK